MTVTSLTKLSQRTLRTGCPKCHNEGPFYLAADETGAEHLVIKNQLTKAAAQGESIPAQFLHVCIETYGANENGNEVKHASHVQAAIEAGVNGTETVNTQGTATETVSTSGKGDADEMAALRELLLKVLGKQQLDETQIEAIISRKMDEYVYPTRTYVQTETETREIEGVTHKQFGDILAAIASGENVQLVGGPGVGKTHVCEQVAEALDRDFYVVNFHLQSTASELKGYMSATGEYVPTAVYDWATNPDGGVLLCDEVDRAHAGILAGLNSILSNRFLALPNREIVRLNKNHVILAATNTWGMGPTWEYPAAQKFSAEFMDRFIAMEIEIDTDIEMAAAMAKGAPVDVTKRAVAYVQRVRENVKREAVTGVVISPRASQKMAALLAQNVDWDKAVAWTLRKGMDDATWRKVCA
ncbi:AAA-ATPase [Mycobacterium phage Crossroads]|uniref:porphyrin biosynthesis n=1 Tax=Mycobacterium phage Crossroads TaxID=1340836 RepID=UPI000387E324|nr:porphyrin biosynthesis [Mycobacterium phage Crossroads]AGT13127.1 AAA-ATPase [Mycobacterium phage Crossroads]UJQ87131.1 AAA-ATPase [Mycobacterium phage Vetrix]